MRTPRSAARTVTLVALAGLATVSPVVAQEDKPSCDTPEHRQFDFWLGSWEVTTPDGVVAGTNTIETILEGCVLRESWHGVSGTDGQSFNVYARDGKWHQTWVDDAGSLLQLTGGLEGDRMVMRGEAPAGDGGTALHEIAWTPRADGAVEQHWRASRDGGKSWADLFLGIYRKK